MILENVMDDNAECPYRCHIAMRETNLTAVK